MTDLPRRRWPTSVLTLVPLAVLALMGLSRRWIGADGLLVARTAENLAAGNGPVVNVGERVEATTSPLWVLITALGHLVTRADASSVAVFAGLALGILGLAAGARGSFLLWPERDGRLALPLGLLVLLAWGGTTTYLTSGTQTGLTLAWIGVTFLLLVRRSRAGTARREWPFALLLGAGPIVDPVLLVPAVLFGAVWLRQRQGSPHRAAGVAVALLPGVVYELFRAGYYAALLPAPLIARQTGESSLGDAWDYLTSTVLGDWLWLPVALLAALTWRGLSSRRALVLAPVVSAVVIAAGQVALGTTSYVDRALVPVVGLAVLPFLVVLWPRPVAGRVPRVHALGALAVLVWAALVGTSLTAGFGQDPPPFPDERTTMVLAGQFPPGALTRADLERVMSAGAGARDLQADATGGGAYFRVGYGGVRYPTAHGVGVLQGDAGVIGYLAPDVLVVDDLGLLDPVAARLDYDDDVLVLAGNRRQAPTAWSIAAQSEPSADDPPDAVQARVVLECRPVAELRASVRRGLTVSRFLDNLVHAWAYTTLDVPADPAVAAQELC